MQLKIISTGKHKKHKSSASKTTANDYYMSKFFLKFTTQETTKSELLLFIQYLKQCNHSINITDRNGMTLLHLATFNGNIEATKLLLENGASSTFRDNRYNFSALEWTCAGLMCPFGSLQTNTTNNHHLEIFTLFSKEPNFNEIELNKTKLLWKEKWTLQFKSNGTTHFSIIAKQNDMEWKVVMSQLYATLSQLNILTDPINDNDTLAIKEILKEAKTNSSAQRSEQSLAMQDEYISFLADLDESHSSP